MSLISLNGKGWQIFSNFKNGFILKFHEDFVAAVGSEAVIWNLCGEPVEKFKRFFSTVNNSYEVCPASATVVDREYFFSQWLWKISAWQYYYWENSWDWIHSFKSLTLLLGCHLKKDYHWILCAPSSSRNFIQNFPGNAEKIQKGCSKTISIIFGDGVRISHYGASIQCQ